MPTRTAILIWVGVSIIRFLLYSLRTDEWLDVMNDIIGGLKDKNEFPEWYEGLHKALFRANEFLGEQRASRVDRRSRSSFFSSSR